VAVGHSPFALAVDEARHTVYVANLGDDTVSVIDGATCNARVTSGCGQIPATAIAGLGPAQVAVAKATGTVYVANFGDDTVSVIDGARCNATITSGCSRAPATVRVGANPINLAIDQATGTIYVASNGDSTVSIVNGRSCNRTDTSGCGRTPPTVPVGGFPFGIAVDQSTSDVYITSIVDSDVAVIHGAACRAGNAKGCRVTVVPVRMGGWPGNLAVAPRVGTFYVPDNVDGSVSLYRRAVATALGSGLAGRRSVAPPCGSASLGRSRPMLTGARCSSAAGASAPCWRCCSCTRARSSLVTG
jgi:DNA-binding beta-propeller fold protein YncE